MGNIHSFHNLLNVAVSNRGNVIIVPIKSSKFAIQIFNILQAKGFLECFSKKSNANGYFFKLKPFVKIRIISTPSRKIIVSRKNLLARLMHVDQSFLYIVSNSKGVISGEEACRLGLGGIIICSARFYL